MPRGEQPSRRLFPEPTGARDLVGTTLGPYHVLSELGRGGMGIVYEARDDSLRRLVALKVLPPGLQTDETMIERFVREARASARLSHSNIVRIFDTGCDAGTHYFVMEFVKGPTLDHLLDAPERAPQGALLDILSQVLQGLHFAHENGIIHRDVKPGNILIEETGRVVVTDFGIAKSVDMPKLTVTGSIMGTPAYMSPEQARGEPVGPGSDVFSAGVILYYGITGVLPFQADTPLGVLRKVVEAEAVPPRSLNPQCPVDLETIIHRALEKAVDRRYGSAARMLEDIQRFRKGEPLAELVEESELDRRRFAALAGEFLRHLFAAVKVLALYPANHPNVVQNAEAALGALQQALEVKRSLTLCVEGGRVLLEGVALDAKDPATRRLVGLFQSAGIDSLTFSGEISADEFHSFLSCFSSRKQDIQAAGGFPTLLASHGVSNIGTDEVVYRRIRKTEGQDQDDKKKVDDMFVSNFLADRVSELRSRESPISADLLEHPERIGRLLMKAIDTVNPDEFPEGMDPKANIVVRTLEEIGKDVLGGSLAGWSKYKKQLAQVLVALEPASVRENVLLSSHQGAGDMAQSAAAGFSDDYVVETIAQNYRRTKSAHNTRVLISRLLPGYQRRATLLGRLKKALQAEGMSEDDFLWAIKLDTLKNLSFSEKLAEVLRRKPPELLEPGFVEFLAPLARELLANGLTKQVNQLTTHYLSLRDEADAEVRGRGAEEFSDVVEVLLECRDEDVLRQAMREMIEWIRFEPCDATFLGLSDYLGAIGNAFILSGNFAPAVEILTFWHNESSTGGKQVICARRALESMASEEAVRKIIDNLNQRAREASDLLIAMGSPAVGPLVERLVEVQTGGDQFESYVLGRKIAGILKKIGGPALSALDKQLRSPDEAKVISVVRIFEDLVTNPIQAKYLEPALQHRDARVRKSAILALEHIGGRSALALLRLASTDPIPDVQQTASLALRTLEEKFGMDW